MQRIGLLHRLFPFIFALLASFAFAAGDAPVSTSSSEQSLIAQAQLKKIQLAAQRLNYSGTFVYQQSSQIRTSRITHITDGKNELEKLEVLDGHPREYIRSNENVACYMSDAKTILMEKRVTRDVFPAILGADTQSLAAHYNLVSGSEARVAGRDCHAIVLEPKDNLRYGYRFWADKKTGLLLKAQTLDEKGGVVEQISFTQIEIGDIDKQRVRPSYTNTREWRVERAAMQTADLSSWQVAPPPGFVKVQEVKRTISDAPTDHVKGGGDRDISQLVFSDGLAAISVFIEPGGQGRHEEVIQQGAMNIIGRSQGDYWLTVVGEVPVAAIRQVSNSIAIKSK